MTAGEFQIYGRLQLYPMLPSRASTEHGRVTQRSEVGTILLHSWIHAWVASTSSQRQMSYT